MPYKDPKQRKANDQIWRDKNKERINQQARENRAKNKEAVLQREREYRKKHKEELAQYQRQYKADNKEELQEKAKQYYLDNKNAIIQYRTDNKEIIAQRRKHYAETIKGRQQALKGNAVKRGIECDLSIEQHEELIKDGVCHYCGKELCKQGGALDRKNNEPFYRVENCVACCKRCNQTFMDSYTYEEKLILAETIKRIDQLRDT